MHGQTRLGSFIEACFNTLVGLVFAYTIQLTLNYAYDVEMSNTTAMHFVSWFTLASVVRSYIIRRIGNMPVWRRIHDRIFGKRVN